MVERRVERLDVEPAREQERRWRTAASIETQAAEAMPPLRGASRPHAGELAGLARRPQPSAQMPIDAAIAAQPVDPQTVESPDRHTRLARRQRGRYSLGATGPDELSADDPAPVPWQAEVDASRLDPHRHVAMPKGASQPHGHGAPAIGCIEIVVHPQMQPHAPEAATDRLEEPVLRIGALSDVTTASAVARRWHGRLLISMLAALALAALCVSLLALVWFAVTADVSTVPNEEPRNRTAEVTEAR